MMIENQKVEGIFFFNTNRNYYGLFLYLIGMFFVCGKHYRIFLRSIQHNGSIMWCSRDLMKNVGFANIANGLDWLGVHIFCLVPRES
jgi:hypothetical protein